MIIFTYILAFFVGLVAEAFATLPPSATSLAVVKYTSNKNLKKALQLAYGAALGEIFIAGLALFFGVLVKDVFKENRWMQITFIALMALAGLYFLFKKTKKEPSDSSTKPQRFVNGLLLGAFNIPMFIYWTAIFSLVSDYVMLDENSPWLLIILFLTGVFLGKFWMLYFYGKLSDYMTEHFSNFKGTLNKIIGAVLVIAAIVQIVRLVIE